jgi:hypothetical protein
MQISTAGSVVGGNWVPSFTADGWVPLAGAAAVMLPSDDCAVAGCKHVCASFRDAAKNPITQPACAAITLDTTPPSAPILLTKAQVEKLVYIVDVLGVPVVCYGLRADFRGDLFEGSKWLLAWADSIEEVKTVCWCGRKATCNARIENGRVVKVGEQIVLGGNGSYTALCRKHWAEGNLGTNASTDGVIDSKH